MGEKYHVGQLVNFYPLNTKDNKTYYKGKIISSCPLITQAFVTLETEQGVIQIVRKTKIFPISKKKVGKNKTTTTISKNDLLLLEEKASMADIYLDLRQCIHCGTLIINGYCCTNDKCSDPQRP